MNRLAMMVMVAVVIAATACSSSPSSKSSSPPVDPFSGFFANPSAGMLELHRDADGKYRGSFWADFGPFPVEMTHNDNVASGTVTYAGARHAFQVENTPQGLVFSDDGEKAPAPLLKYKDQKAYETWFAAQGGYRMKIVVSQPSQ